MPRFIVEVVCEVEAPNAELAWEHVNESVVSTCRIVGNQCSTPGGHVKLGAIAEPMEVGDAE